MRSSAKYRPTETSYISLNDHFAALQIVINIRGWMRLTTRGAQSRESVLKLCLVQRAGQTPKPKDVG